MPTNESLTEAFSLNIADPQTPKEWFQFFDEAINRRGTSCAKFDRPNPAIESSDYLSLWVADMDFRIPPAASRALHKRVDHGIFGYTDPSDDYLRSFCNWTNKHSGWLPQPDSITVVPGIVFALAQAVLAFSKPGDTILIQPPVYYPFSSVIRNNNRKIATAPLSYAPQAATSSDENPYAIDFDAFEAVVKEYKPKLFLLCNPHNPVGRAWTKEELQTISDICSQYDVLIVSDEIHSDFAWEGYFHTSIASIDGAAANKAIICTAPTKTFNLAGLQVSNIAIRDDSIREQYQKTIDASGYGNINTLGMAAAQACYEFGDTWLTECKKYIESNHDLLIAYLKNELPEMKIITPESTYLVWVNFSELGITDVQMQHLLEKKAGIWLDHGTMFGPEGSGFIRFNIATQRSVLQQALERITFAIGL